MKRDRVDKLPTLPWVESCRLRTPITTTATAIVCYAETDSIQHSARLGLSLSTTSLQRNTIQ